jgi:predicted DNA-binding WGR domain protein
MAIVRKEKFIFVESAENHNKFWYIEEHDNGLIKTTWGRVGNKETTSEKQFGSNAGKEYDKLVKSKLKKGYTKLNTVDSTISLNKKGGLSNQSLEAIALEEIEYDKSNKTIVDMIKHFCNSNIHDITAHTAITFNASTNMFQTPCGVVTIDSINNARNILNKIFDYVLNHDYCYDYVKQSEEYCKLIPQKIRGKFDARKLFNTKYDVENQNNLLDALENSIKLIEDLEKNSDNKVKLFNNVIN